MIVIIINRAMSYVVFPMSIVVLSSVNQACLDEQLLHFVFEDWLDHKLLDVALSSDHLERVL